MIKKLKTRNRPALRDWPDADTFRTQIIFKDEFHTGGGQPFKMVEKVSRRRR